MNQSNFDSMCSNNSVLYGTEHSFEIINKMKKCILSYDDRRHLSSKFDSVVNFSFWNTKTSLIRLPFLTFSYVTIGVQRRTNSFYTHTNISRKASNSRKLFLLLDFRTPFVCKKIDEITVEFLDCEDRMGFALANAPSTLKPDGVKGIVIEKHTNTFKIFGEHDVAIREARSMLEFGDDSIQIAGKWFEKLQPSITHEDGRIPGNNSYKNKWPDKCSKIP